MKKLTAILAALGCLLLLPALAPAAGEAGTGSCKAFFSFTWEGKIDPGNKIVISGLGPDKVIRPMTCLDPDKPGLVHKYKVADYDPCQLPDGDYQITAHIVNSWGVEGEESQVFPIPKDTTPPSAVTGFGFGLE